MSKAIVRRVLESTLGTWAAAQVPAMKVAYEGVPFTPPVLSVTYARGFMLPAMTVSIDLGQRLRRYVGIWQVSLHIPEGQGLAVAQAAEASLDAAYTTHAPLVNGTVLVYITMPMSAAAAIPGDGRIHVPISCRYEAHVSA